MTLRIRRLCRMMTTAAIAAIAMPGCAQQELTWDEAAKAGPAPVVMAAGETDAVATANADAADDPAIWRDPVDPSRSLIVGTDKKAGLNLYDLSGKLRHFADAGRVNNVDLIETVIAGQPGVLVAASDRNDKVNAKIALFVLDTVNAKLVPLGSVAAGAGEAYGLCLAPQEGGVDAYMVAKDGTISQIALDLRGPKPQGRTVRTMKLATQSEGCVVDPRTNQLYVAEEDVGLWRFDAARGGSIEATSIAKVDGKTLVADVEGLALAPVGERDGWLMVSSQGDYAYALYRLADGGFAGRFRIAQGKVGAVSETDGIGLVLGDFGADYPGGLFVAQDGHNEPKAQNFKLVAWDAIVKTLRLKP